MTHKRIILILLFLIPYVPSQAQNSSNPSHAAESTYVQDHNIQNELKVGAAKIISEGSSISTAEVAELLSQTKNANVRVNTAPARTTPLPTAGILNEVKKSTVIFFSAHQHENGTTHTSDASGYIISPDGIVATNYHVLKAYADNSRNRSLQIRTASGKIYPVIDVLAGSELNDVAIVRVDTGNEKLSPLPLGDVAPAGSRVYVLSHPNGMFYYFSEGVIARYHKHSHGGRGRLRMAITADYARGSSGGPVVDGYGNLVGMVSSTRSIYYTQKPEKNLQMVVKNTVPVAALKQLISQ